MTLLFFLPFFLLSFFLSSDVQASQQPINYMTTEKNGRLIVVNFIFSVWAINRGVKAFFGAVGPCPCPRYGANCSLSCSCNFFCLLIYCNNLL
ncbi:hypothetical protein BGY98DRAFT_402644 [Russula aff. rugulosa BPL654]|nr:hypothetical protein BGY98DRAFT_402644 [Russula aff. rugulosa BPL654]